MNYQTITDQSQLDQYLELIAKKPILAIDTEFMRRRTLYPEIALIQVFDGEHLALIDPCCELDLSQFWQLMTEQSILKVFHSPSEDVEVCIKHGQCVPSPMFDTQFALSLLGEPNCVGFATMVEKLLNLEIDKSESRTNWLQRPLTPKQLEYAAGDVFYLMPCFEIIYQQILERDLLEVVLGESELLVCKRAHQTPDQTLYLDIKNSWQLAPSELAILRELAMWRREKARAKNLALGFILKEHNMFEIARRKPQSLTQLRNVPDVEAMEVNKSGKEIIACVQKGLDGSVDNYPEKVKRLIDFPHYKRSAKLIKQKLTLVASRSNIPLDVIASKKQINQFLSWHWKLSEADKQAALMPDLMTGWRKQIIGDSLDNWDK